MKTSIMVHLGVAAGILTALGLASNKAVLPPTSKDTDSKGPRRRRDARDLYKLPRSAALSHLYMATEAVAPANYPPVSVFSPSALWAWVRSYLAYVFRKKHDFPEYMASPQSAMYDLLDDQGADTVRIALAGDWGTGTDEAERVADQMKKFQPHFTIHIGDVYYVGDPPEVNENCLGIKSPNNNYDPVVWPIGSRGSFALNGNHEMYANGGGYFDVLLPRLGLCVAGKMSGQQTSFLCLQNNRWRIIAIDTAYNSGGFPVLEQIPVIDKIPGLRGDCKLPDELIEWLAAVVLQRQDNRGLILMSHHQYYSGFEDQFPKPARQLWNAGITRPVLWFWGHEHRLAGYDLYGGDRLQAFGRCVGHGGMPLSLGVPDRKPCPRFYDNRKGAHGYGVNGHVNLAFTGPNLTATYVDLDGTEILRETWSVDASGTVQLVSQMKLISDPDFHA
jgi:hypothetical protein